jgi:hypothetical protein
MNTRAAAQDFVFVDEVDRLVEFHDTGGSEAFPPGASLSHTSPIFSDEVDRVLEIPETHTRDCGPGAEAPNHTEGPLFVDLVDSVVTFRD